MSKGRLFVISGPSAVGKGTIVKRIMAESENIALSVSATTRGPREGEVEGESYYFMSVEEFEKRISEGGFLEHAKVHTNYYGTPKAPVEKQLSEGKDVILEIDVQGAMNVKKVYDHGVYIFILPPSLEELRRRIDFRGTESPEAVEIRMGKAMEEMSYVDRYDYFVINDDLDAAIGDVKSIIEAEHHRIFEGSADLLSKYRQEEM